MFIAPDRAPVARIDLELDKGIAGWTDTSVRLPPAAGHRPKGLPTADELTLGTMSRKPRVHRTPRRTRSSKHDD